MPLATKALIGFVVIVAVKALLNALKLRSAKRLREKYYLSLKEGQEPFSEYVPEAQKLLKDAGLFEITTPAAQEVSNGTALAGLPQISQNLGSKRPEIIVAALELFDELVGVYRMRLRESFSPVYWIETIIFLPAHIIQYLGVKTNDPLSKCLQVIYWILTPLLTAIRGKLYELITALMEKL